jgi:pyruvate/2-oxoglutarate dehydrogenase complex dihydrolipoamide acyltransferase (E2) component
MLGHTVPEEVCLPQAAMGMTDGTVLDWLKNVGDQVRAGECTAELEAAKTTLEIEAPGDGVLARILTPAGPAAGVPAPPGPAPAAGVPAPPAAGPPPPGVQVVPAARRLAQDHHAQPHRRPPGRRRRACRPVPRHPGRLPQQTHGSALASLKVPRPIMDVIAGC